MKLAARRRGQRVVQESPGFRLTAVRGEQAGQPDRGVAVPGLDLECAAKGGLRRFLVRGGLDHAQVGQSVGVVWPEGQWRRKLASASARGPARAVRRRNCYGRRGCWV